MAKKVLLFSHDPGGANTIIPLYHSLQRKGYQVRLFGKGPALKKYSEFGLTGLDIMDFVEKTAVFDIASFIKKEKVDFIITGTSAEDLTEKFLWKAAENLNLPSFAVLDSWMGYKKRFHNLPTKILVMDRWARKEMAAAGIDRSKIVITGQPYFELLEQKKRNFVKNKNIKDNLGILKTNFVITFASEPDCQDQGDDHLGYTAKTIFIALCRVLEKIASLTNKNIVLILKLHPKEKARRFDPISNRIKERGKIKILVNQELHPWDLILASDLVCGMSSMFLIEAIFLKRPALSIQIGLKKQSDFILSRRKIMPSILDEKTLFNKLKEIIVKNKLPQYNFDVVKNPIENVIHQIEKYI